MLTKNCFLLIHLFSNKVLLMRNKSMSDYVSAYL